MSEAARFFQALGDETRLALLAKLRSGEKTVGALVSALGCPQPKVSRHLKVLKDVGLVRDRKAGRHVTYELAAAAQWGKDVRGWLERLRAEAPIVPALERPAARPRPAVPSRSSSPSPSPRAKPSPRADDIETHLL
jgi:DNA-binding transcriptional ArsR family regulator